MSQSEQAAASGQEGNRGMALTPCRVDLGAKGGVDHDLQLQHGSPPAALSTELPAGTRKVQAAAVCKASRHETPPCSSRH